MRSFKRYILLNCKKRANKVEHYIGTETERAEEKAKIKSYAVAGLQHVKTQSIIIGLGCKGMELVSHSLQMCAVSIATLQVQGKQPWISVDKREVGMYVVIKSVFQTIFKATKLAWQPSHMLSSAKYKMLKIIRYMLYCAVCFIYL